MKKYLLPTLLFAGLFASGQSLIPQVYEAPVTGFRQLMDENPYMLQQEMQSGQWVNLQRFTHAQAPNINRRGESKVSQWQSGAWTDVQENKDSFVLDGQNRITTAFETWSYTYSGINYLSKTKYEYVYDQDNRISKITSKDAVPTTSNNYEASWNSTLFYNPDGTRSYDSTFYDSENESYIAYYTYANNVLSSTITLDGTGDTITKAWYTYYPSSSNVHTAFFTNFDTNSDTWEIQNADTFEYDAQGNISNQISWGNIFNGSTIQFGPIQNDDYHYTTSGKLDEILSRSMENGVWENESKVTVTYNSQDKATVGYMYHPSGSGWDANPTYKYWFEIPTGLSDVFATKINGSAYPNPAKDLITIKLDNPSAAITDIKMYDLNGKSVNPVINKDQTIDVSELANGVYSLHIIADTGTLTQKVVVQH